MKWTFDLSCDVRNAMMVQAVLPLTYYKDLENLYNGEDLA